jgi:integrase
MPRVALTDRFVAGAKPDATGRTDYFDATAKGLALRVTGNHKSWTFNFTSPKDGKRARMTLGSYPAMALAKARAEAIEAKGHVDDGRDPRDVVAARNASAMTVADLFKSYMEIYARPELRSAGAVERRMNADVIPVIGSIKLADLHRRDLNRVLDPIIARGAPIQARVVYQNLRAILRWAVSRGDLDRSPTEGKAPPSAEDPRERTLSDEEICTLWHGLPAALAKSITCQRIIKLCLLTAQRVGEVSGMRKDELDLERKAWNLPGTRTKNGHPHEVPLSDMAISIIKHAIAENAGPFVFPAEDGNGFSPSAVSRTIGRANVTTEKKPVSRFGIAQWTAHDLRRTAITGMARLGISPIVLAHVANHVSVTKGDITMAAYNKHEYSEEKRRALDAWAAYLETLLDTDGSNVVPIKAA